MSVRRYTVFPSERAVLSVSPRISDDARRVAYAMVLLGTVTALIFVYLWQAGRVERLKERMWTLESDIQTIKRDNNELVLEIGRAQQLGSLQQRARALGLGEAQTVEYLEVVVPVFDGGKASMGYAASRSDADVQELPAWVQRIVWQFREWARSNADRASTVKP